jgi:hypothetical protein
MKAISIRQPFASMLLNRSKIIETRKRNTHIRERIYIHSSKQYDKRAMKYFALNPNNFQHGYILGTIEIINSFRFENKQQFDSLRPLHRSPYNYYPGVHGWVMKNPIKILPFKYKGYQGWFNVRG